MGTQLPLKRGTAAHFLAHVYCGQTAEWIKMPLGTKVGLGPGHIVLDINPAPPKEGQPPIFGPCLLWPNGRPSQLLLSTWNSLLLYGTCYQIGESKTQGSL